MFLYAWCVGPGSAQGQSRVPAPKREVRAAWVTTVNGLDWPKSTSVADQKNSLHEIVERLHRSHFNTIFFQVRGRGDTMYRSRFEPWSQLLTGTPGKDPGWDPLQFVLDEAHRHNMEVHAWFNTFLIKSGKTETPETTPRHIVLQHPEWLRLVDGEYWIDPGIPAARTYLENVVLDLAESYDIDGIHFDFMRYPLKPFPDESTYKRFGGGSSRDDWRRENINTFVRECYDRLIKLKPMIKVGSAPIGIYKNFGSVRGLQSFSDLFQDSREWMKRKTHDYLVPQVYWSLGDQKGDPDFSIVVREWAQQQLGRQLYVGIGAYKPDIHNQLSALIDISRALGLDGISFFRYEHIADVPMMNGRYGTLANIPPMRWKDSLPPNAPENFHVARSGERVFRLAWNPPTPASDGDRAAYYNVYRSTRRPVDTNSPENILAISPKGATFYPDTIRHPTSAKYYYAVSAFDKGNNESPATAEQSMYIEEVLVLARRFDLRVRLGESYRPPSSSVVYVPYELQRLTPVFIKILDESNTEIASVVDAVEGAGSHVAAIDVSTFRSGVYTCMFIAGEYSEKKSFRIQR